MLDDIQKSGSARVFSKILFVIAGLLFAYFIWSVIYCSYVLSSNFQNGMTVKDHVYQIFDFYVQSALIHLFRALIFAALGVLLLKRGAAGDSPKESPAALAGNAGENGEWSPFEASAEDGGEENDGSTENQ